MKKTLILLGLFMLGLGSFASGKPGFSLELIESRKVWDNALFDGFTDLIRFKGQWYISLREATAHGVWDGNIRIIRSDDGQSWGSAAFILCPKGKQVDLRDPKLSITPEGKLMLTTSAYWPRETIRSYFYLSSDGENWSEPVRIGPESEWLWLTEWHKGIAYNFGANRLRDNYLQLYRSLDGVNFEKHGPRYLEGESSNETAVVFARDDTCYVLLRHGPTAMIGVGGPPYDNFTWKALPVRTGGPEMIMLPNGQLLATVRLYDDGEYTAVCFIDPEAATLTKMLRLPSGGDTSYAGMVLDEDNILWISYYSSHEGKTCVYLAKLNVNFNDAAGVIDVGMQKQLFIDDYIIAESDRVFKVLNQPVKYEGNPVIELKPPLTAGGARCAVVFGSVIYDEQEKLFKIWYEVSNYNDSARDLAYAISVNGVNWDLPCLNLFETKNWKLADCQGREGSNNIVLTDGTDGLAAGVFKDLHETDPAKRYKMLYASGASYTPLSPAFSADGINWTTEPGGEGMPVCDSFNPCMWDDGLGKYVAHPRHNAATPYGEERQVYQYESDDFINWTQYGTIMKADEDDAPGHRHFYQMCWMKYENCYIAFLDVFHLTAGREKKDPLHIWEDRVDVQLAFSRDNRHWERVGGRQRFMPNSKRPGEYDFGVIYTMQSPVVWNDEIWIYYGGNSSLHWARPVSGERTGVCLAKLRLDGFISMDTGSKGSLTTKTMTTFGDKLVINADAKYGSIKVEVLDAAGKPIKGFTKDDADVITGDSIRHTVKWNGKYDLSKLKGKAISLKFYMDRCRLYSFVFKPGL